MKNLNNEDQRLIVQALFDRSSRMFHDYEAYKAVGNKEAMKDCLAEMKMAELLADKITDFLSVGEE